jgi:hypothetical protein
MRDSAVKPSVKPKLVFIRTIVTNADMLTMVAAMLMFLILACLFFAGWARHRSPRLLSPCRLC